VYEYVYEYVEMPETRFLDAVKLSGVVDGGAILMRDRERR